MLLLTEQALGGRIVSAAATTDGQRLLVATDAGLGCYELQAAGGDPACAVHRLWQQPVSGGRVEYAAPLTHAADYYLLLTSHAGGRTAQAAVVRVLPAGGGLVRSAGGRHHVVASLQLDGRCELHEEPPARPAFSALAPCAGSNGGGALVLAAALWQATVHVLRAERSGSGGQWSLSAGKTSLYNHLTSGPGAWWRLRAAQLHVASARQLRCPTPPSPLVDRLPSPPCSTLARCLQAL